MSVIYFILIAAFSLYTGLITGIYPESLKKVNKKGKTVLSNWGLSVVLSGVFAAIISLSAYLSDKVADDKKEMEFMAFKVNMEENLNLLNKQIKDCDTAKQAAKKFGIEWNDFSNKWEQRKESSLTIVNNNYARGAIICPVEAVITAQPNNQQQTLCNEDKIPLQYLLPKEKTIITIPYMKGKDFAGNFLLNNYPISNVGFDKTTGTFDLATSGMTRYFYDNDHISFSANVPAK